MAEGGTKAFTGREPGRAKMPTGIVGFDEITRGGLPRGRTTLVAGEPGTGKTIFALQCLVRGVRQWGEPGVFLAFEEPTQQIVDNATFGWDVAGLTEEQVSFLDAHLSPDTVRVGDFDLAGMLAMVGERAEEIGATRVVFDSIDVLLRLMDDPSKRRHEVYRIREWLSETGLTGIITARTAGGNGDWSRERGFLSYIVDCVVQLSHWIEDRVSLRSLQVIKYRGSGFAENAAPMVISSQGIEVENAGSASVGYPISEDRVSSGLEGLDGMLRGGYLRGTSTLVTGAPGTAKTTLAGLFAETTCRRGEPTLYVCFDEAPEEIVRNLRSVGVDLQVHVDSGTLRMIGARPESRSADVHLLRIRGLIDEQKPRHVVIDPVSAITKAGGFLPALSVARRLIYRTKEEGISLFCTSLLDTEDPGVEATPLEISTLADTWIHLSYQQQQGERNRALTIVKSRGTGHSNQTRELVLGDDAIDLQEVYAAGGEVLMGTLRWEKERELEWEHRRQRAELQRRREQLELAEAETIARRQVIEREIEARQADLAALRTEADARERMWRRAGAGIRDRRKGGEGESEEGETEDSDRSQERGV